MNKGHFFATSSFGNFHISNQRNGCGRHIVPVGQSYGKIAQCLISVSLYICRQGLKDL